MSNAITTTASGMLSLIHNGGLSIPKPFSKPILLLWVPVMGLQFVNGITQLLNPLDKGNKLTLVREPENRYDKFAILVKDADGQKIGYVPRRNNLVLARLMDAGKALYATVHDKSEAHAYPELSIDVYMED
ncbi:HIRAN domain-containing protein [uncultured Fibrobacter sp.]|jgi:hypothetical protein|uniref:HIRAN domain-containing protein n=1 Tax=uncultured Fibrobacter sp. TaxID=261512 RepID=UPI0025FF639C|nr:HIRAN domain-containing protein [uncultured Fibrobacter sp.]